MRFVFFGKELLNISASENFQISMLGHNVITFYNHILMKLSKDNAVFKCDEELCAEVMTRDVISQCTNSSFNNQYMKQLLDKYGDKFSGIALYNDGELCGYICGLRPKSEEIQYRIKKCEFFVKYVFVYEKFRGKRVASKLFEELFDKFPISEVEFAVRTNNHSAIKSYKKTGAKEIARRKFVRILKFNIPYYKV